MLVFSQKHELFIDPVELLRSARKYFDAELEVLAQALSEPGAPLRLRLIAPTHRGDFVLRARSTQPGDLERAARAELAGRAAGMASLAARCPAVWTVEVVAPRSERALLNLCAILAAVALGPVLPDDDSSLFGVRGAMDRAARAS